ncbi:MAG: flagellar export chaperone FliS [Actinomycetota bacterium]
MHHEPTPDEIACATPDVLTLMLFQGAVRFGRRAQDALAHGDTAGGAHLIGRVRAIIRELDTTLNHDAGPISGQLASIYEYLQRRLLVACEQPGALAEVVDSLDDLGRTWQEIVESRAGQALAATA